MPIISIVNGINKIQIEAAEGDNLLELLRRHKMAPDAPCGGRGTCGKCKVYISEGNLPKETSWETAFREVLACQTLVDGDCTVRVRTVGASDGIIVTDLPAESNRRSAGDPSTDSDCGIAANESAESNRRSAKNLPAESEGIKAAEVEPESCRIGAAIDLGTTTVVASVFDLDTGRCLGTLGEWNRQIPYGADVISRTAYCMEHPDGLRELSHIVREQVRSMIQELLKARMAQERQEKAGNNGPASFTGHDQTEDSCSPGPVEKMVIAGNTIMQHIFAGLDPSSIARAPYQPLTLFRGEGTWKFDETGDTEVIFLPCIAGFVGGDITAGMLQQKLDEQEKLTLFLDIGTNGEMALGNKDGIVCCSVASGPAFEGAEISCGMQGKSGAINHITCDGTNLKLSVIGSGTPQGICGSGLIDLLAVLLREEIVVETGLLQGPEDAPEKWKDRILEDENGNGIFVVAGGNDENGAFLVADDGSKSNGSGFEESEFKRNENSGNRNENSGNRQENSITGRVVFTAADVRKLQLAKAAVCAGINILLKKCGHQASEIGKVLIAGGFGLHLNPENMAEIGMIPQELKDKVAAVGNTSLAGAAEILLNPKAWGRTEQICNLCSHLELSMDPDFSDEFIDQMMFE